MFMFFYFAIAMGALDWLTVELLEWLVEVCHAIDQCVWKGMCLESVSRFGLSKLNPISVAHLY